MPVKIWKLLEGSTQSSPTPSLGSSGLVFGTGFGSGTNPQPPMATDGKKGLSKASYP